MRAPGASNCALDTATGRDSGAVAMGRTHPPHWGLRLRGPRRAPGLGRAEAGILIRVQQLRPGREGGRRTVSRLGDFHLLGRVSRVGGGQSEPHSALLQSRGLRGREGGEGNGRPVTSLEDGVYLQLVLYQDFYSRLR